MGGGWWLRPEVAQEALLTQAKKTHCITSFHESQKAEVYIGTVKGILA